MEVKPGYKHTEVGVIPVEWDIKPMRAFGKFAKGIGLLKEEVLAEFPWDFSLSGERESWAL